MSSHHTPSRAEIVAVWHMAFGEPPVLHADEELLLGVLQRHFPDVFDMLTASSAAEERYQQAA